MKYNIFPLKYNNYYNRIVKKFDNISDYEAFAVAFPIMNSNINFLNSISLEIVYNNLENIPDYIVLTNELNDIHSRWFVLEHTKKSANQYVLKLKRDVIADNIEEILDSPSAISKATLESTDPFIFNNESQSYNKIKTSETLIKDELESPWIIGFIPSDSFETEEVITSKFPTFDYDLEVENIEDYIYFNGYERYEVSNNLNDSYKQSFIIDAYNRFNAFEASYASYWNMEGTITSYDFLDGFTNIGNNTFKNEQQYVTSLQCKSTNTLSVDYNIGLLVRSVANSMPNDQLDYVSRLRSDYGIRTFNSNPLILQQNNLKIKETSTGSIYTVKVNTRLSNFQITPMGGLLEILKSNTVLPTLDGVQYSGELSSRNYLLDIDYRIYEVELIQTETNVKLTIPASSNRISLIDSPYDMFAIPFSDVLRIKNDIIDIKSNSYVGLNLATSIATILGNANIYDIQILPYCPIRSLISEDAEGYYLKPQGYETVYFPITNDTNEVLSVMIWCDQSNFRFNLDKDEYKINIADTKIKETNDLDSYRICSPNYSSVFEFNAAKNYGVDYWEINCTYKPFSPYIHINPNFKGLYGKDFNDARGLILSGDYSITILSSAWANYELENKNYQNIFDREIDTLELQNKYGKIQDIAKVVSGTVSGVAGGAVAGGLAGGPTGSIIGGGVTGVASLGGGIADVYMNSKLRNDNIDKTKDIFNYSLQNIQAIPNTISKLSSFVIDTKIFPFLEYYTCSSNEREAYNNMIKYNGMTVNKIGTLREFIKDYETYIELTPIRLLNIDGDFTLVNEISNELSNGIYIKGDDI